MNDTNRSLNEVPALIKERRRYEQWLAALDARRDTTPQHVLERVKADYQGRLQRVQEQLALHRQSILEERASVESRRSLIEAEEQLRRDERSELELRSHVGELAGAEADGAFRAVDDALEQLAHERKQLEARIEELEELLELRTTPAPAAAAPAPVNAPPSTLHAAPDRVAQHAAPRMDERAPARGQEKFDELAFLSEVVGENSTSQPPRRPSQPVANGAGQAGQVITRDEAAAESLARSIRSSVESGSAERPLAANVPANTPIVLRTAPGADQSKSLKCGECGAMNYPTEWYCERCGAELAAL
ncbi:MAG TPA: Ran-binding zinc finger domain-containing protein [Gemmatimonadaceae bacterium]